MHKEWQPLEEILGVVLNRYSDRLKGTSPGIENAPEPPPRPLRYTPDGAGFFQSDWETPLQHTPTDTPIEISAAANEAAITIEIADRGPGIPDGEEVDHLSKVYPQHADTDGGGDRPVHLPRHRRGPRGTDPGGKSAGWWRFVSVYHPHRRGAAAHDTGRRFTMKEAAPNILLIEDERQMRRFLRRNPGGTKATPSWKRKPPPTASPRRPRAIRTWFFSI